MTFNYPWWLIRGAIAVAALGNVYVGAWALGQALGLGKSGSSLGRGDVVMLVVTAVASLIVIFYAQDRFDGAWPSHHSEKRSP